LQDSCFIRNKLVHGPKVPISVKWIGHAGIYDMQMWNKKERVYTNEEKKKKE
jgi:hypothetical protein